jgi:hypothetical protein
MVRTLLEKSDAQKPLVLFHASILKQLFMLSEIGCFEEGYDVGGRTSRFPVHLPCPCIETALSVLW